MTNDPPWAIVQHALQHVSEEVAARVHSNKNLANTLHHKSMQKKHSLHHQFNATAVTFRLLLDKI